MLVVMTLAGRVSIINFAAEPYVSHRRIKSEDLKENN